VTQSEAATEARDAGGHELTQLLRAASAGDAEAFGTAYTRVYDELRRLAARVRHGRASDTLDATALVHEAYAKLAPSATQVPWEGRRHFFALAARAMRQVLVSAARERLADKRGGGLSAVPLSDDLVAIPVRAEELISLDEALERLAAMDARQARVVEHRFFLGLTAEETAEALGISTPTVQRDWRSARAWLADALGDPSDAPGRRG
jgi:RNA polymerase sigma factor (TIGR02999 family)